ncbi:hypothetical protein [Bacillus phage CP-51]|uniref:Uncharacterized protein n=1 Tax=Bacillus phage CP-51 TaxID=1391188 RepID=A0A068EPH6_9CAUD|nr:hypothetical protein OZ73_gp209 [Bacillus phage CP-51]AID50644.1 hypothetical protein [Bacillus phage CP-51]
MEMIDKLKMIGVSDIRNITIEQPDIPEPYLTLKKHLTDIVWDETIPARNKEKASQQLQELDKEILMYLVTQPLRIVIKEEDLHGRTDSYPRP